MVVCHAGLAIEVNAREAPLARSLFRGLSVGASNLHAFGIRFRQRRVGYVCSWDDAIVHCVREDALVVPAPADGACAASARTIRACCRKKVPIKNTGV